MKTNVVLLKGFVACIILSSSYDCVVGMDNDCKRLELIIEKNNIKSSNNSRYFASNNNKICNNEYRNINQSSNLEEKINKNSNTNNKMTYNKETMWFDYQRLLEKIEGTLSSKETIEHTDFETNTLARNAIFGCDCINYNMLSCIKDGDKCSLYNILLNMKNFLHNEFEKNEFHFLSYEQFDIMQLNYDCISNILNNNWYKK